jgi:hypothetical protein
MSLLVIVPVGSITSHFRLPFLTDFGATVKQLVHAIGEIAAEVHLEKKILLC